MVKLFKWLGKDMDRRCALCGGKKRPYYVNRKKGWWLCRDCFMELAEYYLYRYWYNTRSASLQ